MHLNDIQCPPEKITLHAIELEEFINSNAMANESFGWTYDREQEIVTIKLSGKTSEESQITVSLDPTNR